MKCPYCKAEDTGVIDSRLSDDGDSVRRRRECAECGKRFTTYERVELSMPMVVKSNGHRVPYEREKIRTGFQRALHKRPVPAEYVEAAIQRVEQRIIALGEREVASRVIGEMVMRELKKLDDVAYIRFASVYEDFQRVDDFRDAILQVKRPRKKRAAAHKSRAA
ncbi:MAG: transcriptional repressor NrdR [Burkholderiales bacterium]|nr:transcriptional repressor NrdR [Burkholderiales bacterium]